MKKLILIGLLLAIFTSLKAQVDSVAFAKAAAVVKAELAPDKRLVYFSYQIKNDTVIAESSSEFALKRLEQETKQINGLTKIFDLLPSKFLNGRVYGLANLSVCNNRSTPQNSAEMMTQMLLGTPVQVLKKQGGFYLVRTPDQYISWTDATAVTVMDSTAFEKWKKSKRLIYLSDYGHAYSEANDQAARVSDLVNGNILEKIGEEQTFYKVKFPDGRFGYLKKSEVMLFSDWRRNANPSAESLLTTAKTLLGVPYLWGGTSVKGVDCSGFTKTSYFLNGIIIPRDASQQALVGEEVDVLHGDSTSIEKCLKNLKPGDLLFFAAAKLRGTAKARITHTAIYMGDGQFIQSAGMVRINSLKPADADFDEREFKTLVGARRYLNQIGKPEITRIDRHDWYGNY